MNPFREAVRAEVLELVRSDPEFRQELLSMLAAPRTELLDTAAFAALKGLNRDTVVRMVRAGRIPSARKEGREWRFPADDLQILPKSPTGERQPLRVERRSHRRAASDPSSAVDAIRFATGDRDAA